MNTSLRADRPVADARVARYVTELVSAYVRGNALPATELPALIEAVQRSIEGMQCQPDNRAATRAPSETSIKKSIHPDYIISFLDGKPYKTLKRHITCHGLTPPEYRARFGLPADYPMVSSSYAATRARIARNIGLGSRAA